VTAPNVTAQPELCISVRRSQGSITRGRKATYIVRLSTENTSASDVSVTLTAQPSGQKPTFTGGCTKGDGTALCTITTVSATQPAVLRAQVAVASSATAVKLTATATIVTAQKWQPPTVTATTAVTAASSPQPEPSLAGIPPLLPLPLGPIPDLYGAGSTLISAGNVTGLFPTITPSPAPSPTASPQPQAPARRRASPAREPRALSPGPKNIPAEAAGLIALVLAILLAITRLFRHSRSAQESNPADEDSSGTS
jgi:hypothetical protein